MGASKFCGEKFWKGRFGMSKSLFCIARFFGGSELRVRDLMEIKTFRMADVL